MATKRRPVKSLSKGPRIINGKKYEYLMDEPTRAAAYKTVLILRKLEYKARVIPYKGALRLTYWRIYVRTKPLTKDVMSRIRSILRR